MKIEHIALYVNDLEKIKEFYQTFFNATSNTLYHNAQTGFKSYFLSFDTGARLEIMNIGNLEQQTASIKKAGYTHLAFSLGSKDAVTQLTKKLCEAGYTIVSEPRTTGDGYYESGILDPENNLIELTE